MKISEMAIAWLYMLQFINLLNMSAQLYISCNNFFFYPLAIAVTHRGKQQCVCLLWYDTSVIIKKKKKKNSAPLVF